jgi:hypothetical protein
MMLGIAIALRDLAKPAPDVAREPAVAGGML